MPEVSSSVAGTHESEHGVGKPFIHLAGRPFMGDLQIEGSEVLSKKRKNQSSISSFNRSASQSGWKVTGGRRHTSKPGASLHTQLQLNFPVARIKRYIRAGKYANRVSVGAAVFAAGVLDYLVSELIYIAIEKAQSDNRTRVKPRDIQLAIRDDDEFRKLLNGVVVAEGGGYPKIHEVLRQPHKATKKPRQQAAEGDEMEEGGNVESQEFGED